MSDLSSLTSRHQPSPALANARISSSGSCQDYSDLPTAARAALTIKDDLLGPLVYQDLCLAMKALSLTESLATQVLEALRNSCTPIERAREIVSPYRQLFYQHFEGRSEKLAKHIKPALLAASTEVLGSSRLFDWGTGDTQVARQIQLLFPKFEVSGGDIIPYYENEPLVPFYSINNNSVPSIPDNSLAVVTLNYVLHHEEDSRSLIKEVSRMLTMGGRAIIVELQPCGQSYEQQKLDKERLWFSDFIFCNIWHKGDSIPMPGNYKNLQAWEDEFSKFNLKLLNQQSITGTPVIYANSENGRKLMVFEKVAPNYEYPPC
jgi:SAM-dependent methyltransferase